MNENLIYTFISSFRALYELGKQIGSYQEYNDDVFDKILRKILDNSDFKLSEEEITILKKNVDAEFQIYQPDGTALVDDYEHASHWYTSKKDDINHFFWNRYRKHLFDNGWSSNVIDKLDYNTLDRILIKIEKEESLAEEKEKDIKKVKEILEFANLRSVKNGRKKPKKNRR